MPCLRCGRRQTDPARGPSPWKRLVVSGEQVLVCPECQGTPGWDEGADRCASCGSSRLGKALGVVQCKQCGAEHHPDGASPVRPAAAGEHDTGALSDEVAAAVTRLLKPDT